MQESPGENFFQEKEIHLSEYLMVLLKRRTLIILVFILTVLATAFYSFSVDPVYESSARLIIDKESSSSPITGERTDYESYHSQTMTFNTSIKMITSTPVIKELIAALNLDAREQDLEISFIKNWISQLKANVKRLLKKDEDTKILLTPEEQENRKMQALIAKIKEKITVEQVRDTRLLNLSVRDKDPELAAAMVNTLAKKFMEFNLANKMEASRQTLEWLNNELYDLRKKLEDDEQKFFDYKQKNMVFSIEGKQKQAEQKIQEFNTRYLETRNRRLELDAKINELNRNLGNIKGVANVRSLINNPLIENIYGKIIDLEIELSRLSKIYKSKHPQIVQTESELEKSRKSLAQEIAKEVENLKSERKVLYAREKTLEKNIAEFEEEALDTSAKELQYTILQRNVNTSKNLYELMVSKIKESNILQTANTSNIRLVETAQVPVGPVSPNKKRNLLLSIVLGLFFGCGLAFFFEYMDQTVRTEEDIHQHFNLPVLSVIPKADKSVSYGADY
ncbi:MAG: GumC family protein [Desulfotignum sp.]|nr:GumC family protein [Desulfotignum sp.]